MRVQLRPHAITRPALAGALVLIACAAALAAAGPATEAAVALGQEVMELPGAVVLLHASLIQLGAASNLPAQ